VLFPLCEVGAAAFAKCPRLRERCLAGFSPYSPPRLLNQRLCLAKSGLIYSGWKAARRQPKRCLECEPRGGHQSSPLCRAKWRVPRLGWVLRLARVESGVPMLHLFLCICDIQKSWLLLCNAILRGQALVLAYCPSPYCPEFFLPQLYCEFRL